MRGIVSLLFVILFFTGKLFSQELDQTLVWKISGNDLIGKSYVVGTMPIQDSTFYKYPSRTFKLIAKTNAFLSFDTKDYTSNSTNVRKESFKNFDKNYAIYPAQYLEVLATQELKPIISLSDELSYQNEYKQPKSSTVNSKIVQENFLKGNTAALLQNRLQMDIDKEIYNTLQSNNNYLLVEQFIQQMRGQSLFFPIDVVYLEGQNGVINLLKARGYKVSPMFVRDFKKQEKQIEKQKLIEQQLQLQNAQATQNLNNLEKRPATSTGNQQTVTGLELLQKTETVNLKVPMGIINLKNWGNYSLLDGQISYKSPNRLKSASEYESHYETMSNNLTYSIKLVPPFKNKKQAVEKIVIDNGGQLTYAESTNFQGYPAMEVELIYSENSLSKHYIIYYPTKTIIASVKGETPKIFSIEQQNFFDNIVLKQIEVVDNKGLNPNEAIAEEKPWIVHQVDEMHINLPIVPKDVSTTLQNGKQLRSYVIPRGEVDDNVYLFSSVEKEPEPLFKMFNEAINTAAEQARAVIVERNVLPAEAQYYSYYLLKDAVDNYYSIHYWYIGGKFYQSIIKGGKKTINNQNAKTLTQSIYFPSKLPTISN